jgi:hypothetical protein
MSAYVWIVIVGKSNFINPIDRQYSVVIVQNHVYISRNANLTSSRTN